MSDHRRHRGTAIGAVLSVAIIGAACQAAPASPSTSAPAAPTASPSPVPTLSPTASPMPSAPSEPVLSGMLAPGTYVVPEPFPVELSITLTGDDWQMWTDGVGTDALAMFNITPNPPIGYGLVIGTVDNVLADPCKASSAALDPPIGPTPIDLATALAGQPLTTASAPVDVTLGEWSGTYVEYALGNAIIGCSRISRWMSSMGPREAIPDEHDWVWILDVEGVRLVIDAFYFPGTSEADLAELEAIVESLDIVGVRAP